MPAILIIAFFATAVLYASVGFGGGSTYNALLILHDVDYRILPTIALVCNIIVVSGGVIRFARDGNLRVRPALPFLAMSVPMAWLGGRLEVSETVFVGLLGFALFLSGLRLALQSSTEEIEHKAKAPAFVAYLAGGVIGFVSGLVGIGGGIFLAPVLYFLTWDSPRRIAATCSLFILANSLSGLAGQLTKLSNTSLLSDALSYWPLAVAVLIGGQIGSWAASRSLRPSLIKGLTAILILYVAARLIYRWIGMMGWI